MRKNLKPIKDHPRTASEEWVRQVCELLNGIARYERKHGTCAAPVGYTEQAKIGTIVQKWSSAYSAQRLLENAPTFPE